LARRPRRSSAETRAEILATAENLFRSGGYEKTSVHDIAATIGMSPANVFKHFPSKMALVEAIGEAHLGHIAAGLDTIPADLAPPLRLRRFAGVVLDGHLDNMENNPHVFDIVAAMIAMKSAVGRNFEAVANSPCPIPPRRPWLCSIAWLERAIPSSSTRRYVPSCRSVWRIRSIS